MYLPSAQLAAVSPWPPLPSPEVDTLYEQGSGELNEDVILLEDGLYGVFDGATSLDKARFTHGLTGGLLAAQTAAEAFRTAPTSPVLAAQLANHRIGLAMHEHGITLTERHRLWSTSMAVVRLAGDHFTYCQTGDSLILLIHTDGSHRLLTPEIDIDRQTLQQWRDADPAAPQPIHDLLAAQISRVRLEMNRTYGVLNGEPAALDFLCHGRQATSGISDILLFTDGLFLPRHNLEQTHDWQAFVDLYRRGGLSAIGQRVRELQRQDPAGKMFPRFKCHDDIAALAIRPNQHGAPAKR